ncbi:MAG: hypothetical protein AAB680_04655, partial [Pseudomonadota bacterium]
YDGVFNYQLADAYTDWEATQTHSNRQINLEPSGREIRFSAERVWYMSQGGYFGIGAGQIVESGHNKDAKPEAHIYLRGAFRF